jgi:hypothetical protein
MSDIVDFKIRNDGPKIVLIFVDKNNQEIQKINLSWISGYRLMKETEMAVDFGFQNLKQLICKVK